MAGPMKRAGPALARAAATRVKPAASLGLGEGRDVKGIFLCGEAGHKGIGCRAGNAVAVSTREVVVEG